MREQLIPLLKSRFYRRYPILFVELTSTNLKMLSEQKELLYQAGFNVDTNTILRGNDGQAMTYAAYLIQCVKNGVTPVPYAKNWEEGIRELQLKNGTLSTVDHLEDISVYCYNLDEWVNVDYHSEEDVLKALRQYQ